MSHYISMFSFEQLNLCDITLLKLSQHNRQNIYPIRILCCGGQVLGYEYHALAPYYKLKYNNIYQ